MRALKLLLSKQGVFIGIALLLFVGGVTALYYIKYRPLRNDTITLRAENKILRENLKNQKFMKNLILEEYSKLAKLPRYQIDQHLDRIKIKRGSSLEFSPHASMRIDSVQSLNAGDSIIINLQDSTLKNRTWVGRQLKSIGDWFR